ncbi:MULTISPECIES: hypothetical protein [Streptomyces]|uniref:hypothetical protein n=1 Tax=Streptomyces TaxID=1883 RepID=UPI0018FE233B|nr:MULTISPECIES: hypothetical protein [Streptomyces]MDW4916797.1 hypothetical protein [Streptomyces californicus]
MVVKAQSRAERVAEERREGMEGAVRDGVPERRERLMESLRIYGGHCAEPGRCSAARPGPHSADVTAVLEVTAAQECGIPCHRHG